MEKTNEYWIILFLFNKSIDYLKDAYQTLDKRLDPTDRFKPGEIKNELLFFFVFALDYWLQKSPASTDDKVGQAFFEHLENGNIIDLDILDKRLVDYGQVVNTKTSNAAMLSSLGSKLGDYCGSGDIIFLILAPELFLKALEFTVRLEKVQKRVDSFGYFSPEAELEKVWAEPLGLPGEKQK